MGLLDLSKALAPVEKRTVREKCHDFEGAFAYFQQRVIEQSSEKTKTSTWVKKVSEGPHAGKTVIEVRLHSMPLYWKMEPTGQTVEIKNPDGSVRTTRDKMIGFSRMEVDSEKAGWDLLHSLAAEGDSDDEFVAILTRAAKALEEVDKIENDHKNAKAEMLFNDNQAWVSEYGKFSEPDEKNGDRMRFSRGKTNKKNQAKQSAARILGYERAKIVEYSTE
jgi:hypothetical protein